jgi:hypothetical protein
LQVQRENAQKAADAMSKQGMYGLGGALLGSPSGMNLAKNALSGLGRFGSSALSGLGGLFGGSSALPDWASGITDPETLNALGLGGGGLFGSIDPTGGWLTAANALTGGGVNKAAGNLVSGAGDIANNALSSIGDMFDW